MNDRVRRFFNGFCLFQLALKETKENSVQLIRSWPCVIAENLIFQMKRTKKLTRYYPCYARIAQWRKQVFLINKAGLLREEYSRFRDSRIAGEAWTKPRILVGWNNGIGQNSQVYVWKPWVLKIWSSARQHLCM